MNEGEKWQARYERERSARKEAERLLEEKSLALYRKTQQLDELVAEQKNEIKERTRDYESASAQAELLSDAVSRTENGVIITGPDDRVIWVNQAIERISGYDPSHFIGKKPGDLLQGKDSDPEVRKYMRRKISERAPFTAEIVNYRREGQAYWVRLQATPVFDPEGNFKYFVAIQTETTGERETMRKLESEINRANRMAKQAEEANAAKTKFLATMSHELRTPLNGIIGYAQILEQSASIDERTTNQIRIMRRSGEHLLSLINDLLDVTKIEAGSHSLAPSRFELEGMLRSVVEILSSKAREKGLKLKLLFSAGDYQEGDKRARPVADSRALRQILINLIGNAIKFTDKGSVTLEVDLTEFDGSEAELRFAVVDTGRGIPKSKLATLFDPFTQVDETRDIVQGSGLGLFIAQRLVEQMGGELDVQSTVERGSCFSFRIRCPLDFTDATAVLPYRESGSGPEHFPSGYRGPPKEVLVVDDIADNRLFLRDLLQPLGFKIDLANNGREALQKISGKAYDIVLSDVIMPFMSGYELVKSLRSDERLKDTCIVAVSASLMQLSALEKNEIQRFDGFIAKPIQTVELFDLLRRKLGLDWVYKESTEAPAPTGTDGRGDASPTDALQELHWLARIGDIRALREKSEMLAESAPELYQALRPLLKSLKTRQAAELIYQRIGGSDG